MNSSNKFDILRMVLAVGIALLISFLIILIASDEPLRAILELLTGPLKSTRSFGNVIEKMIPLIFTGVGISIMFSANQINLAGEGSFHLGGLVATYIALNAAIPMGLSPWVCVLVAGFLGSLVTAVPAVMKIKTDSDVLVSSLMMNYIIVFFANYVLNYILRDPKAGAVVSFAIPAHIQLNSIIPGTRIHLGLFIALAVAFFGYVLLYKTKIGYEIRITGENMDFAKYSGINVLKVTLISQLIGGFIFGIGGGVEILGMYNRFSWTSSLGYGWDAIIITTLAKKNPLYVPFAAFFLAYLRTGASKMSIATNVPTEIITVAQGIIILLVVAEQFLSKYKHKMIAKEARLSLSNAKEAE